LQINSLVGVIMFAYDTSILVSQTIKDDFTKIFNLLFLHTSK